MITVCGDEAGDGLIRGEDGEPGVSAVGGRGGLIIPAHGGR